MTNLAPANWQDWAAVAQIIALGFVIFAALLARNQIIEATKARQLSVFNEILDQISRPDVGEARRWIFAAFPKETKEVISNADMLEKARKVAVAYDRVGFFIKNELLPREESFFEWQGDDIEKLWGMLSQIVEHFQTSQQRHKYCNNFKYLGTVWVQKMKQKKTG